MNRLAFRRLRIDRFPGVTEGFELRGLASGVNVVYGPNASGKTTSARALETLLWPKAAAPSAAAIVEASIELGDDRWAVRLEGGRADYQRNGLPASPMPTAPPEGRDRYRLWLPDLLKAEDATFARQILVESSGGFDLDRAARVLEGKRPSHRSRSEQTALRLARERLSRARAAEEALSAESASLAEKEGFLTRRLELEARLSLCALALEHTERLNDAERARREFAALPEVIGKLRGDEAEQIAELRLRAADAEKRRSDAMLRRAKNEEDVARVAISNAVLEGDVLQRLTAYMERLSELERDLSDHENQTAAAVARLAEEEGPLRGLFDPNRLASMDLRGLGELISAAEAAEQNAAERRAIEAELIALPTFPPGRDLHRLQQGILLLKQWLTAGSRNLDSSRLRIIALSATALMGVAAIILAFATTIWAAVPFIVASLILLAGVLRVPKHGAAQADREREYLRLGLLQAPDRWESDAVDACLTALEEALAEGRESELVAQRRQLLSAKLEELTRREQPIAAELREVAAEVGLRLPTDTIRLFWLADRISRWQRARTERIASEKALVQAFATQRATLEAANALLEGIGLEGVGDCPALKGCLEKLRADLLVHETHARAIAEANAAALRETAEIQRLEDRVGRILARVGISREDEFKLTDWCATVETYRSLARTVDLATAELGRVRDRFSARSEGDLDMLLWSPPKLVEEEAALRRELSALNGLAEEVGSLRARVEAARKAHALEEALADEAAKREALLEVRDRDLRAAVAALLVEYVERETRKEHLPQVFHRANELFNLITRGAYELIVADAGSGAFRAYDTRTERSLSLDELSSGTRVQLLLAVRIAFVEALEAGVALPLLMDETLANSDDERAAAILDAVIQLAAHGRQVFYFTAQPDEVFKWHRALANRPEVEWVTIDLGEVRRLERRVDPEILRVPEGPEPSPEIPEELTHAEFVDFVAIPSVELQSPAASLHPWYLIEDAALLRYVLQDLRVASWGELSSLLRVGGASLPDERSVDRVRALADIAGMALSKLRIGRGRPIDRSVLMASGAVSDRFIDELDALAKRAGGVASALIDLLESRAVPNFLRRNVESLRAYFEEEGYLDSRDVLRHSAIRQELVAQNASLLTAGTVSLEDIDRLLTRLVRGAGFAPIAPRTAPQPQAHLWPELFA